MQVYLSVLQANRVVRLLYIPQSSMFSTPESKEDCTPLVGDVWTVHQQVLQTQTSALLAAVLHKSHWGRERVGQEQ